MTVQVLGYEVIKSNKDGIQKSFTKAYLMLDQPIINGSGNPVITSFFEGSQSLPVDDDFHECETKISMNKDGSLGVRVVKIY